MAGERVVIADDNLAIFVSVYRGRESFTAEVSPLRAVWIARLLLDAALPKLAAGDLAAKFGSTTEERHTYGKR